MENSMDLLIIDGETGLLSHPSTLECVSQNSGILFIDNSLGPLARESHCIIKNIQYPNISHREYKAWEQELTYTPSIYKTCFIQAYA